MFSPLHGQPVPPPAELPGLGAVDFPTSCSAEAQEAFERGVALLHSFAWERAIGAFEAAGARDPDCAMAQWGIAASNARVAWGPAYIQLEDGLRAIRRAQRIGARTSREREYVAALAALFQGADSLGYAARLRRHVEAMERLYRRHADDREAGLFYSVALLGTVDAMSRKRDAQLRAGAIAERVFSERPNHPGAAHYIIHAYDYPELAERALPAARRYAEIAPATPHARHMPSHIYSRLGLWEKSIESNRAVLEVAGDAPIHAAHSLDYLVYAHLQRGQLEEAAESLDKLMRIGRDHPDVYDAAGHAVDASVRHLLEREDWAAAASLELDARLLQDPRFEATVSLARALGAARSGDLAAARAQADRLPALRAELEGRGDAYPAANVAIWHPVAVAWIRLAEGSESEALRLMREAVRLDEAKSYVGSFEFGPDELVHTREQLGALLLELERPSEALREYELSLEASPDRFNALLGAARAAHLAGSHDETRRFYERLLQIVAEDAGRPEIEEAREFLGGLGLRVPAPAVAVSGRAGGMVLGPRDVGAVVRVRRSAGDPAWRLGMFQRSRAEPPCYLVALPSRAGALSEEGTLLLSEVGRMQVHGFYNGRDRPTPTTAWSLDQLADDWRDVALDSLQRVNRRQCRGRAPISLRAWLTASSGPRMAP